MSLERDTYCKKIPYEVEIITEFDAIREKNKTLTIVAALIFENTFEYFVQLCHSSRVD